MTWRQEKSSIAVTCATGKLGGRVARRLEQAGRQHRTFIDAAAADANAGLARAIPVGRGWRSGWLLSYDTDGQGNPEDYIVGLSLPDVDAAVTQAREYLRSAGALR